MEEGIEMDSFSLEEGAVEVQKKPTKKVNRKTLVLALVWLSLVFVAGIFWGSNVALWKNYIEEGGLEQPSELEITAEFQMNLYPDKWKVRDEMLNEFFSYFQSISGYPFLSQNLIENYRLQNSVRADNCTSSGNWKVSFRLRNYIWGPSANTSTFDAKIDKLSYRDGLIAPLEPSDDQLETSFQKLENDIHACDDKYSRESRVRNIPFQPTFVTCGDIHQYYPYIWDDDKKNKLVNSSGIENWYTGVYEGVFDNGVTFKTDITLRYQTLEDLYNGSGAVLINPTGEFSLRIWSTHLGHGPWNQTSFDQISSWHRQLLQQFGSEGDYPC